jgi:hypothetical protein
MLLSMLYRSGITIKIAVSALALGLAACARAGFSAVLDPNIAAPDGARDMAPDSARDAATDSARDAAMDRAPDIVTPVTCDWSQGVTVGTPQELTAFNTPALEFDPTLSPDGLTLYFVRVSTLYQASRPALGAPFGKASPSGIATGNPITGHFHLTSGGLLAVTHASWSGSVGLDDIWISERSSAGVPFSSWSHVTQVATDAYEFDPHLAPDGLTLWFQSRSSGSFTLYRTERADIQSAFTAPVALGNLAATPDAQSPSLTDDLRTLVFAARTADNGYDIFFATRGGPDKPFGAPQPVPTVNSSGHEVEPFVRRDGCELFFGRMESGGSDWQLYRASVSP